MSQFEVYVGIDWGASDSFIWIQNANGVVLADGRVKSLKALISFIDDARGSTPRSQVGCAIERSDLSIVAGLFEAKFPVFWINPKTVDRFRDRYSMAGAKDDRRDAFVLASTLQADSWAYRAYEPQSNESAMFRALYRSRGQVLRRLREATNQLSSELFRTYPGLYRLCSGADKLWFLKLIQHIVCEDGQDIEAVMKKTRVRKVTADDVKAALRSNRQLSAHEKRILKIVVEPLLAIIILTDKQKKAMEIEVEIQLKKMSSGSCQEPSDVDILRSMPGFGPLVTAIFIADLAKPLRDRDRARIRSLTGIAPVTKQSGRTKIVKQRRACIHGPQQAMFHAAVRASIADPRFKDLYVAARARGHSRGRALRTVGDAMLRILVVALKNGVLYEQNFSRSAC